MYDHTKDTTHYDVDDFEFVNVVAQPAFAATAKRLRELLTSTVATWQK